MNTDKNILLSIALALAEVIKGGDDVEFSWNIAGHVSSKASGRQAVL